MRYPLPFIDNVIPTFKERNIVDQNNVTDDNDDEPALPPYFLEVNKHLILLKLPFCQSNFDIAVSWETRKIQTCKIYYGVFECGEDYIGETKRNTITRWSEHDNATKDSEQAWHLNKHINHFFTWKILCHVSEKPDSHKNLESIFIALLKPSLNEQKNFERLSLFRNGIT